MNLVLFRWVPICWGRFNTINSIDLIQSNAVKHNGFDTFRSLFQNLCLGSRAGVIYIYIYIYIGIEAKK